MKRTISFTTILLLIMMSYLVITMVQKSDTKVEKPRVVVEEFNRENLISYHLYLPLEIKLVRTEFNNYTKNLKMFVEVKKTNDDIKALNVSFHMDNPEAVGSCLLQNNEPVIAEVTIFPKNDNYIDYDGDLVDYRRLADGEFNLRTTISHNSKKLDIDGTYITIANNKITNVKISNSILSNEIEEDWWVEAEKKQNAYLEEKQKN